MRAAVARAPHEEPAVEEAARREPGVGEVVVSIRAAGICQTDLTLADGGFGQRFPVVLGHEGAGEVVTLGAGVTDVAVGDRVLLSWVPPCGRCYHCVRGETWICSARRSSADLEAGADLTVDGQPVIAGMGTATFAEETVVPARGVIPIPDDLPFELAALLGCAVPTGFGAAVHAGRAAPGDTVLVIGCGAVGLNAIQGARIAGAAVIVGVDPQPARRERALELGATEVHDPDDAALGAAVAPVGFDLAIDAVGRSSTIRAAWDATRRGGRVVVVGAGKADDAVPFSALELFHDEKTLRGTFYGSSDMRHDVPMLVDLWRRGALVLDRLVDAVVPLDRIGEGIRRQRTGEALRVVVTP